MIKKINSLMQKGENYFFHVFLAYAAVKLIASLWSLIDYYTYSANTSFYIYRTLAFIWDVLVLLVGTYFLLKKKEEETKIYFLILIGYSIASRFFSAWTWVDNIYRMYNPTFITVSIKVIDILLSLSLSVFAVSYIVSRFIKKDIFKYLISAGLGLGIIFNFLQFIFYIIGAIANDYDVVYIIRSLSSTAFLIMEAAALPILSGKTFDYAPLKKVDDKNKSSEKKETQEE